MFIVWPWKLQNLFHLATPCGTLPFSTVTFSVLTYEAGTTLIAHSLSNNFFLSDRLKATLVELSMLQRDPHLP